MTPNELLDQIRALAGGSTRVIRQWRPAAILRCLREADGEPASFWEAAVSAAMACEKSIERAVVEQGWHDLDGKRLRNHLCGVIACVAATARPDSRERDAWRERAGQFIDPELCSYWIEELSSTSPVPSRRMVKAPVALVLDGFGGLSSGALAYLELTSLNGGGPTRVFPQLAEGLALVGESLRNTILEAAPKAGCFAWRLEVASLTYEGQALTGRSLGAAAQVAFSLLASGRNYSPECLLIAGLNMTSVQGEEQKLQAALTSGIRRVGIAKDSALTGAQVDQVRKFITIKTLDSIQEAIDFASPVPITPGSSALGLESLYVRRPVDETAEKLAQDPSGRTIVIFGPRGFGKRSMVNRLRYKAEATGRRVANIQLSEILAESRSGSDAFFRLFCDTLADSVELTVRSGEVWDAGLSPLTNCRNFMVRHVLRSYPFLTLFLEDSGVLLGSTLQSDFYTMLRSWHNRRSDPTIAGKPWREFSLVMTLSEDPNEFIQDPSHSPFNVGDWLVLPAFEALEVAELLRGHGLMPSALDLKGLLDLTGGLPVLCGLIADHLRQNPQETVASVSALNFEERFRRHFELQRAWLSRHPKALAAACRLEEPGLAVESQVRRILIQAGIARDGAGNRFSCEIYRRSFRDTQL